MKLIHMLSVSVATVGMTCLAGYAVAADTAPGDLIPDSMLVAQGTAAPGGKGGGSAGEIGRADKGTPNGSKKQGGPGDTKPRREKDTGTGENTGSDSGRTGTSSGSSRSSTGPAGGSKSSGMSGSGSGSSGGAGAGGK